jgi:hypothetical protein
MLRVDVAKKPDVVGLFAIGEVTTITAIGTGREACKV